MTIEELSAFLGWCTVLNFGLLLLWGLGMLGAGERIYRLHSKWFPMPRENFHTVMYALLGLFKMGWAFFNLVPYLALRIFMN